MLFKKKKPIEDVIFISKKQRPIYFNVKLNKKYYRDKPLFSISYKSGIKLFYRFLKINDAFNIYLNNFRKEGIFEYYNFYYHIFNDFHNPFDRIIKKLIENQRNCNTTCLNELKKYIHLRKKWFDLLKSIGLIN